MNRKKIWIFTSLVVGAVVLMLVLGLRGDGDDEAADEETAESSSVPVRVVEASNMTFSETSSYSGTIEAWEQAHITGPSGERIEEILVREGDRVERGQVLARMDDSNLRQAEVELRTARTELERTERLVEVGSVARQQYEQAEAQYETALSSVELLRKNTELTSPIDGVVTDKHFVAGEQFATSTEVPSIVTVQQTNPLKVVINVSEQYFPVVHEGMPAAVRVDAHGERTFEGQVEQVHATVSPDSRTFRVEVALDNAEGRLGPGMFARVSLELGKVSGTFLPSAAVQSRSGSDEDYVYVVEGDTARRVDLRTGERIEEYRHVLDGPPEDALVVTEGMGRIDDGSPVRIVD